MANRSTRSVSVRNRTTGNSRRQSYWAVENKNENTILTLPVTSRERARQDARNLRNIDQMTLPVGGTPISDSLRVIRLMPQAA